MSRRKGERAGRSLKNERQFKGVKREHRETKKIRYQREECVKKRQLWCDLNSRGHITCNTLQTLNIESDTEK
jgi:hypothetical protein